MNSRAGGFTLIEVIVAIVLTGIVTLLAYGSVQAGLDSANRIEAYRRTTESEALVRSLVSDALRHPADAPDGTSFEIAQTAESGDVLRFVSRGVSGPLGAGELWRVEIAPSAKGLEFSALPLEGDISPIRGKVPSLGSIDVHVLGAADRGSQHVGVNAAVPRGSRGFVSRCARRGVRISADRVDKLRITMNVSRRKGVALMLALWLIVLLTVVGARVVSSSRSASGVASNLRARLVGRYAAESGIVLGAAQVRDSLNRISDLTERAEYLNSLQLRSTRNPVTVLSDEVFSIVYVDVNSRLDVNNASQPQLTKLFSYFAGAVEAGAAARAVREWIDRDSDAVSHSGDLPYSRLRAARPLRTLDELRRIPGMTEQLALAAAPYLTVDGDGRINRTSASDTVLSAAAGQLVDAPTRILIISRGWLKGHALTHEIQAVYGVEGNALALVRWQERDL